MENFHRLFCSFDYRSKAIAKMTNDNLSNNLMAKITLQLSGNNSFYLFVLR